MAETKDLLLRGSRLLIVEDEFLIAADLADVLRDEGAEILGMAGSVEEAQAVIEAEGDRLDGAVLDVNLGRDRVYPVADALMARKVPFVFATGYDVAVIPEAYAEVPRFEKPVRAAAVVRFLAEQISR